MRISVAMATYNGAQYLQQQLDSINLQTRLPDELVICDDGSADSTLDVIEEFTKLCSFEVRVFRNEVRLGSTKNFERAILMCTGDIIALCDQDDVWIPEKLERQSAYLEENPNIGGVFSNARLIDHHSHTTDMTLWETNAFTLSDQEQLHCGEMLSAGITRKKALGCTLLFRSSLVQDIVPIPERWEHDGWIAWIIGIYSRLDVLPDVLMCYRIHPKQQFGVKKRSFADMIFRAKRSDSGIYLRDSKQLSDLRERVYTRDCLRKDHFLRYLEGLIGFLDSRASLPSQRLLRLPRIFRHFGSYWRFSSGWLTVLKDIVRDI